MLDYVTFWQHGPTTAVFEISLNPLMFVDAPLRAECLQARLAHVCEGHAVPSTVDLKQLAQEAVLMCLRELKVVTFVSDHWAASSSGRIS